jgi:signal transduction histidine kinase
VLFVAMVWALAFVLDQLQSEDTGTKDVFTGSEKLQSQKMEALGRLAGGVAHDFNNLLAVISGYSDLLLDSVGSSDPNRAKLEKIKQAANSAASLTRQLLMFSRQQVILPLVLDINQIVANTEKMVRRLIKENIEFTVTLEPTLACVRADSGQIEQIILNLVVNARDALPHGGKLSIQTSNVRLDEDSIPAGAGILPGRFVLLEVTDTGTGMDQRTQAHIFEPFFTTKALGKGTGLGLATVYGIGSRATAISKCVAGWGMAPRSRSISLLWRKQRRTPKLSKTSLALRCRGKRCWWSKMHDHFVI